MDDLAGCVGMRRLVAGLIALVVFAGAASFGVSSAEEPTRAPPKTSQKGLPLSTNAGPPATASVPTSATAQSLATPLPSPGRAPEVLPSPTPSQAVQCNCSSAKGEGRWTGRDWAALLGGLAGLAGAFVAAMAIVFNGRASRATTVQKANEAELESLRSKLDGFYGPYLQLSNTNRLIATDLKNRHAPGPQMRILLILLDPKWEEQFSRGEVALVKEILSIDDTLLKLIQEQSGLVSDEVQPYLWRAASHFRIMKLASENKLDNDPDRYAHYVYPRELDEIIQLEIDRIHGRINLIQTEPMVLHPPAAELAIPPRLKLSDWPVSSGGLQSGG